MFINQVISFADESDFGDLQDMKLFSVAFVYFLLCSFLTGAYAGYGVGDVVNDYTWSESDGGAPVSNSIYGIVDSGKVFIFEIAATW